MSNESHLSNLWIFICYIIRLHGPGLTCTPSDTFAFAGVHAHRHGATRPRSCSLKWADGWLTEGTGPWKHFVSRISNGSLLAHWPRREIRRVGRINMWDKKIGWGSRIEPVYAPCAKEHQIFPHSLPICGAHFLHHVVAGLAYCWSIIITPQWLSWDSPASLRDLAALPKPSSSASSLAP